MTKKLFVAKQGVPVRSLEINQICDQFCDSVESMEREELQIALEKILDRLGGLALEAEEEIERQRDLLLEAAGVYVENGRLPNLPAEKTAWVDGERDSQPPGFWGGDR